MPLAIKLPVHRELMPVTPTVDRVIKPPDRRKGKVRKRQAGTIVKVTPIHFKGLSLTIWTAFSQENSAASFKNFVISDLTLSSTALFSPYLFSILLH
jgi:hypothetical protein